MVFFPTHEITIYREIYDGEICGTDNYGKARKCFVAIGNSIGDFQPLNNSEPRGEFGDAVQGMYRLFLCPDVEIDSDCKVGVEGYDTLFQVEGTPQRRTALIPHIKVILKMERKSVVATELPEEP